MADTAHAAETRSASGFDLAPPTEDQLKGLEADLTDEERDVLLHHVDGRWLCAGCEVVELATIEKRPAA